jgi:2-(3-amino-3-carboxypropyl)histidine synthase
MSFDFELNRIKEELIKRKPKIVLIQLPEGLKSKAPNLTAIISEYGSIPIVSADPCYGACDLAITDAKILGADLLIHYGHTPMNIINDVPILYIEVKSKNSVKEVVKKAMSYFTSLNKIGLVTTVQHVHQLEEVKNMLNNAGKITFIGDAGYTKYAGQVLGCDFRNAQIISDKVDSFLFIGGGTFHAIGVTLATEKPTIIADPYEQIVYQIEDQIKRMIMQRWANISEAKKAKSFGILISLKNGQTRIRDAIKIKEKLEKHNFLVTLLALREITPNTLIQFPGIDSFINTACPRISFDDAINFDRPILSINEALVMLGELKWEDLFRRGWFENVI